jgi:hypothetical protein
MPRWLKDHSLSLSFVALSVAALVGQSIAGHSSYNSTRAMYGFPAVDYIAYLRTGNFLDGVFVNWQAAILQLTCLIVFGSKFREKGSAHSLKPKEDEVKSRRQKGKDRPWIYRNSLSIAFIALFVLSFIAHMFFGATDYNERLALIHKAPIGTAEYSVSSSFWFSNGQTWEAEFAAIAIYLVLSVFLRQQGSSESKPVDSSDSETGETNH